MFDLDGNGNIDVKEYEQVCFNPFESIFDLQFFHFLSFKLQEIIRKNSQFGQKHRDTHINRSVIKINSALHAYFFGPNSKELLTVDKFIKFQKQLQNEVVKMEVIDSVICDQFDVQMAIISYCKPAYWSTVP